MNEEERGVTGMAVEDQLYQELVEKIKTYHPAKDFDMLKKIPEPMRMTMAKDKFPKMGMDAYQSKLVGNPHRKSAMGTTKSKT